MCPRQAVETQRLADVFLGPIDELRILSLPFADSGRQTQICFMNTPSVVVPMQLLQAIVFGHP